MFAVTILVFSALIMSFYSLSQNVEKSAMQESFKIVGSGVANKITAMDTLVNVTESNGGTVNALEYELSIPETIASKSYTMNITNSTYEIIIEADDGARTVVPFSVSTDFTGIKIYSGSEAYRLYYNKTTDSINLIEKR